MASAKQTKQDGEDTKLILYRLDRVEGAVTDLGTKLDKQDNIKRSDLADFRDTLVGRVSDLQKDFQRQLDDKADASSVADIKKLIAAFGAFFLSLVGTIFAYLLSRLH
jgi:hypothetical protein